jgi:hypothetical protein
VADEDPVPQQAVDLVDEQVQVTVRREFPAALPGCEQTAEFLAPGCGEMAHPLGGLRVTSPLVRLRIRSRWHTGTAHMLPYDDPLARLRLLPWCNSLMVRLLGTDLLTVRVDLHDLAPPTEAPTPLTVPSTGPDRPQ